MNILKQHRVAKGLTLDELAARIGVSRASVSNWEIGRGLPQPKRYPKLARVLGITPLHLAQIIEPSEPELVGSTGK
jgi:transcriptional regulator with XRE-family HTH domain